MSQRTALLISLALTVLVGFAIVANRDRLIGASPGAADSSPTATAVIGETIGNGLTTTQSDPRIVEITLPTSQATQAAPRSAGDDDDRSGDSDNDDRGGGDDREEEDDD